MLKLSFCKGRCKNNFNNTFGGGKSQGDAKTTMTDPQARNQDVARIGEQPIQKPSLPISAGKQQSRGCKENDCRTERSKLRFCKDNQKHIQKQSLPISDFEVMNEGGGKLFLGSTIFLSNPGRGSKGPVYKKNNPVQNRYRPLR